MKNLLLSLTMLLSTTAIAQSGEPVSDTSYILPQGSLFFEVKTSIYQDGSELTTKTLIGDTTTLIQSAKDRLLSKSATMAVDIRWVSQYRRKFTDMLRESDAVATLTGTDPQRVVQDEYSAPFLEAGWSIKRDGASTDIAFAINGQGALRYSLNGGTTKAALLVGSAMRLKNYPSNGTDTDLYMLQNGVWSNADRTVLLRPPGNNNPVNRSAAPPPSPTRTSKKG